MGFLDDIGDAVRSFTGGVDGDLLATGILGRADLLGIDVSGTTIQIGNGLVERKCDFTLQVYLEGEAPFPATCTQRVGEIYLPQLVPGQTVLAVRVDPGDRSKVAIDFASDIPNITVAPSDGHDSAAWILANGSDAAVVLVANQPMGLTSASGDPVHALTLTIDKGADSYQVQVGNGVPNSALPLVFPGSKLHAKIGDTPNAVVVDWSRGARGQNSAG
ncbi:hypothetical protein [Pseudolysinimonas sp.]|uniref:hypothetical protein n=1 Tax=Pseudolysinimonas sp. TaxID=2680009 RepID=UPI003783A033